MTGWLPEPLKTERLTLRPTGPSDRDWVFHLFTDPEVRKYLGGAKSEAAARDEVAQIKGELWGHFAIVDRATGVMIGSLSFAQKRGPWEISYQLGKESWGQGFAGEAIKAALQWFFAATGETEVSAVTQTANLRSCRLLERLGASAAEQYDYRGAAVVRYVLSR